MKEFVFFFKISNKSLKKVKIHIKLSNQYKTFVIFNCIFILRIFIIFLWLVSSLFNVKNDDYFISIVIIKYIVIIIVIVVSVTASAYANVFVLLRKMFKVIFLSVDLTLSVLVNCFKNSLNFSLYFSLDKFERILHLIFSSLPCLINSHSLIAICHILYVLCREKLGVDYWLGLKVLMAYITFCAWVRLKAELASILESIRLIGLIFLISHN